MKRHTLMIATMIAVFALPATLFAQKNSKITLLPPTLSATPGSNGSQFYIDLTVTAASTGVPYGFSVHWMKESDYLLYGWAEGTEGFCAAGFSGNANDSRYDLAAGEAVTVRIGELLLDNGASTTLACSADLECATTYVFRVFAHAGSAATKSAWSPNLSATTLSCHETCRRGQGYWKNHPEAWPVTSLNLGNVSYDQTQLLLILSTPVGGGPKANGLIALAHQLIAAKLNVANGASSSPDITTADNMIGSLGVPPVGSGYIVPSTASPLVEALDTFNHTNGCPD